MINELCEDAAKVAEDIEQADTARDAQLIGNTTGVEYTCDISGRVKEITVQFNSRHASVSVDLYSGALTAARGMGDTHRVPLFEDNGNTEAVLNEAIRYWEQQAQESGLDV
jgi:ferritin-like metal-binding protein YciE